MKRIYTGLVAAALAIPAAAQNPTGNGTPARPQTAPKPGTAAPAAPEVKSSILQLSPSVEKLLRITPDQKTRIDAIEAKFRKDTEGLLSGGEAQEKRRENFQKYQAAEDKAEKEALAVLSPEQRKLVDSAVTAQEEFRGLERFAVGVTRVQGITPEQRVRLRALSTEVDAQRKELMKVSRGQGEGAQAAAFRMQAMQRDVFVALRGVLTPPQFQQLLQFQKKANSRRAIRERFKPAGE